MLCHFDKLFLCVSFHIFCTMKLHKIINSTLFTLKIADAFTFVTVGFTKYRLILPVM